MSASAFRVPGPLGLALILSVLVTSRVKGYPNEATSERDPCRIEVEPKESYGIKPSGYFLFLPSAFRVR